MKQYSFLREGYFDEFKDNIPIEKILSKKEIDSWNKYDKRIMSILKDPNNPITYKDNVFNQFQGEQNKFDNLIKRRNEYMKRSSMAGMAVGGTLGGAGGYALSSKLGKVKQRKIIKNIVINSDNPKQAIEELRKINTPIALKYAQIVSDNRDRLDWKNIICNNISLKNGLIKTTGTLAGATGGAALGRLVGLEIQSSRFKNGW